MFSPVMVADREARLLAPYAQHSCDSAGRRYDEPEHCYRSIYQRDRDRITHCAAFRRLSHKTQVFTGELGDYPRSRLTHTLEVASIARTLARALRLNEDLVEALALLHDIGHPPFGHAGEEILDARLVAAGGFNHNAQALRIVEQLEIRYPWCTGLNLSYEVLEGQRSRVKIPAAAKPAVPKQLRSLESQVVDAADSIAYDAHDVDDALELGLLSLGDLTNITLWRDATRRVQQRYANLDEGNLRRAVIHELINAEVSFLLRLAEERLHEWNLTNSEQARHAPPLFALPIEMREQKQELQQFLFDQVYRHPTVLAHRQTATAELSALFDYWNGRPDLLPALYQERIRAQPADEEQAILRAVGDFLASFTDRSARHAFARLRKEISDL